MMSYIVFLNPLNDFQVKNKDENFMKFICKTLPAYMKMLEDTLNQNDCKYLVSEQMSLADIAVASHFFKLAYNDLYENQHIMQAVMSKYTKANAWAE